MGTISQKISYLAETKQRQKNLINALGGEITNETPFREYENELIGVLPKVTGEGTNFSLSPTIEYDLEVGSYKGDTKQDTLTGINLADTNETIEPTTINGITYSLENGVFSFSGTPSGATTITLTNSFPLKAGTYTIAIQEQTGSYTGTIGKYVVTKPYTVRIDGNVLSQVQARTTTEDYDNCYISFYIGGNVTFTNLKFKLILVSGTYTSSTLPSWEQYCGGIPSPNPNYPQDIQVVTGTQTVTISNADNTETQTYTLHLGDEELGKIGNYQDYFYKSGDKWYKHQLIKKHKLASVVYDSSYNRGYINLSQTTGDLVVLPSGDSSVPLIMSETFKAYSKNDFLGSTTLNGMTLTTTGTFSIRNTTYSSESAYNTWLSSNDIYLWYVLRSTSIQDIELTDTTLLQDLNYIKEHIKSYSGTTNITSSGDLSIVISASALRKLS